MPKMRAVSAMMDPTALPSARPALPLQAAITDTAHSGLVVPRDTIVASIITLGRPSLRASPAAPSTSQSAPLTRKAIAPSATSSNHA